MTRQRALGARLTSLLVVTALLVFAANARADAPRALVFDGKASALGLSLLGGANLIVMYGTETPQTCRVCAIPRLDQAAARWLGSKEQPELYARISDGLVLGGMVLGGTASLIDQRDAEPWAQDLAIIGEAVLATELVVNIVKRLSARVRPAIYFSNGNARVGEGEAYQSFFSGHSASIASVAASVTALAYLREYSYRDAALVAGVTLSLSVGLLRMAADRHWLTDVVTGWVIGAAIGAFVPLLFHEREDSVDRAEAPQRQTLPLVALTF